MQQEEEPRMTFPLIQVGINATTCIIPEHNMVYKEYAEGVKPHAAVTPLGLCQAKKLFPVTCGLSQVKH